MSFFGIPTRNGVSLGLGSVAALQSVASAAAAVVDAFWSYVTLLLPGNGTNGAQNNTFTDSSTNAFTITRSGNTTQGTFTPYGANWSNYFNGSTDYLTIGGSGAWGALSTGAFTVECWIYISSNTTIQIIVDARGSTATVPWQMYTSATGKLVFMYGGSSLTGSTTIAANTWAHVAAVRSSGTITLYVNGVADGSVASSANLSSGTVTYIGRTFDTVGTIYYAGFISNFRTVLGTAVYTGAFTPPTAPLTAISGTSLLTCQSNRFIDNSSNAFALTVTGTPSVQRFSPFSPSAAYSTSVVSGSAYFDGTGDTLGIPSITVGTSNFCFECWFYPPVSQGSTAGIFVGSTSGALQCSYYDSTGAGGLGIARKGVGWDVANSDGVKPTVGQWNHIAFVRSGTGANQTSIFLNGTRIANGTSSVNYVASTYELSTTLAGGTVLQGYVSNSRLVVGSTPYDATQSTLTVPTAPLTAVTNTQLLLLTTNAGIIDNAMMNDLETVGNAQISTTQSKFGGSSIYFDGTTSYLLTNSASANVYQFGTGDYTIEMWLYPARTGVTEVIIDFRSSNSTDVAPTLLLNASSQLQYAIGGTAYISPSAATAITVNAWTHFAFCRSSGVSKMFLNGIQVGSVSSDTSNIVGFASRPAVGVLGWTLVNNYWQGYIDDLRITKGYARYTANFTPPTVAFPTQ